MLRGLSGPLGDCKAHMNGIIEHMCEQLQLEQSDGPINTNSWFEIKQNKKNDYLSLCDAGNMSNSNRYGFTGRDIRAYRHPNVKDLLLKGQFSFTEFRNGHS